MSATNDHNFKYHLTPITNRAGELPADNWFQLVPTGEWPHVSEGGKRRVQVIDPLAVEAMANSFKPKILVDQEHWSYEPDKSSEALGWIVAVEARADGLWGRIEWTDTGTAAVTNKRYRFLSPVWLPKDVDLMGTDRVRPRRIDSVGLTNTPNLKGILPLSNREGACAPAADKTNTPETRTMKNIATKLGLSAEASEDAILAEVVKLQTRATGAETQVTALTTERGELKNRVTEQDAEQIDAELDARNVEETKRARLKPVLAAMKNRADRVAFLDDVVGPVGEDDPASEETTTATGRPVLNRQTARQPKPQRTAGTPEAERDRADKAERAVQDYRIANRCSYSEAHAAVMRTKPEFFGLPAHN